MHILWLVDSWYFCYALESLGGENGWEPHRAWDSYDSYSYGYYEEFDGKLDSDSSWLRLDVPVCGPLDSSWLFLWLW
jgi:hypothetical protein